ncbi:hypothetical protein EJ03DRAFT_329711 [Teratosphaeria nubilosa]|uniref:Uncharacterized protein n=1 Tax=Teratosphaeria nubilosa TaxID=161662 RepID=A0A6G1L1Q4_9PEZI|nr:hypothetical protein EJ03DRAFT_329711 [Teratosphaeria nubilosa]
MALYTQLLTLAALFPTRAISIEGPEKRLDVQDDVLGFEDSMSCRDMEWQHAPEVLGQDLLLPTSGQICYGNALSETIRRRAEGDADPPRPDPDAPPPPRRLHRCNQPRNMFLDVCNRQISGRSISHFDVYVPLNDYQVSVATPSGGSISFFARLAGAGAEITAINQQECPIRLDWVTDLRVVTQRRGVPPPPLPPVQMQGTPRREWQTTRCRGCLLSDIILPNGYNVLSYITIRIILQAYYC